VVFYTLCLSCYYFYIVLSLYLYCCYVVYLNHHFTVICFQTCVLCVCLVITSTLFYFYTCTVVLLCSKVMIWIHNNNNTSIKIQQCRSNNKTDTEYTSLNGYYSKVMICIHNITTVQV
jgi:hypothetical protein